jgi:hypothetical protein
MDIDIARLARAVYYHYNQTSYEKIKECVVCGKDVASNMIFCSEHDKQWEDFKHYSLGLEDTYAMLASSESEDEYIRNLMMRVMR